MKRTALILFMTLFSIHANASDIIFFTHNLQDQTYMDEKGELRGKEHAGKRSFNLEVVREMMILMSHPRHISEMPFIRGMKMVQNNPGMALFNVSRTPDREHTLKWVGPLQKETDYLYEVKNRPTGIHSLEDAREIKAICVLNGGIHHRILQKHNFRNIVPNVSYVGCFKMLQKGRVALTPSAASTLTQKLRLAGVPPEEIQQTPVILLESEGYVAFSKTTPDTTIEKWQAALDQLKESGKYRQLYRRFYLPDNTKPVN